MSIATAIRPPAAIYREEQNFGWWVYALLAAMAAIGLLVAYWIPPDKAPDPSGLRVEIPLVLAVGLILPSVLVAGVLRMTTEVTPTQLRVWFGWLPTYRKAVSIGEIQALEVVRYRPIRECGGWGIRTGPNGERVLNARGDRGVRLLLNDGTRLLIGSQRPDELARALQQAQATAA